MLAGIKAEPRYVAAEEASFYRQQVAAAKAEAKEARLAAEKSAETRIDRFLSEYAAKLRFDYKYAPNRKPFLVSAIWNDGRFTYIRAGAKEAPAFYEVKDGRAIIAGLDVEMVLSNPATCVALRTLFAWCTRAMGKPRTDRFRLADAILSDLTAWQLDALPPWPKA